MKLIEVGVWRALFGWPFYVGWNFVAHVKEQPESAEKVKVAILGILFVTLTTGVWAAAWITAIRLALLTEG